jgi:hypothetical protein
VEFQARARDLTEGWLKESGRNFPGKGVDFNMRRVTKGMEVRQGSPFSSKLSSPPLSLRDLDNNPLTPLESPLFPFMLSFWLRDARSRATLSHLQTI